jgi:hypothetical protein
MDDHRLPGLVIEELRLIIHEHGSGEAEGEKC